MKIIGTFSVVMAASIALLQPAEGRGHRGGGGGHGRSFSSGHSFSSGSGRHFSGGSRNFSRSNARSYRSAPRSYQSAQRYSAQRSSRHRAYSPTNSSRRFSSQAALRDRSSNPRYAANRTADFSRRAGSDSNARFAPSRRGSVRSAGFNNNGGRVVGNHTRSWNRNRDYHWRGNRCRWRNNSWVIIGPWFYPWGYGYYPYASYSYYDDRYYDDRYYDDGYAASEDARYEDDSGNADSRVSQVQAALAREGYYRGAIDGSVGPATRNALRRYQRNQGLDVTGRIDRAVIEALGLG